VSDLLPPTLRFLHLGWWISHLITIALIAVYAYRKGRRDEKNARLHGSDTPGTSADRG
jgi:hypothetical protein